MVCPICGVVKAVWLLTFLFPFFSVSNDNGRFSVHNQPLKPKDRKYCPFFGLRYSVGFGGGRYDYVRCIEFECYFWSEKCKKCRLLRDDE